MAEHQKMKFESQMQEFIALRKLKEVQLDLDYDNKAVVAAFSINVGDENARAVIEANEDGVIDFYIYFTSIICRVNKRNEMEILMNKINERYAFGKFQCFEYDNSFLIRWGHRVDFEDSNPSGLTILRNFQPGWDGAEAFANVICAVALTNRSAQDVIEEYDNEKTSE